MQLLIRRIDQSLPLPKYATAGSVGLDLLAREEVKILPGQVNYVPLNVALKLPPRTWALLAARSSLHKKGLMLANGIGVGDADFSGNNDEYQAALFNFSSVPVTVSRGDRLVQLIVVNSNRVSLKEVAQLTDPERGGFGSTGG